MSQSKQKTGKILISIAVALTAIVSTIVDLLPGESGHVFNPTWSGHAVFHDIVMFLLLDFMAIVCLWLLWRKSLEPQIAVKVNTLLVLGFWTPFYYVTTFFPQASLAAANEGTPEYSSEIQAVTLGSIAGMPIYINVCIGTVMIIIALIGYYLYNKGRKAGGLS
jgi:hypothetical protein